MSVSTISGPDTLRALFAALLLALLAGCGTTEVTISGQFPPPLVEPLPVTLGVWYPPEFAEHEFYDEAKGRSESDWLLRSGEAQVAMWDQLLAHLFTDLRRLDAAPTPEAPAAGVDAVFIPRVDELQYAIPAHTNIRVYEIWLRYAFELQRPDGDPIANWTMTAYGKTPTAFLQTNQEAVRLAGVVALRDAGAHFITSLRRVPDVAQWLEQYETPAAPAGRQVVRR
mgnify:CR=1 FL=1